jgi:hypothetical protein
LEYLWVAAVLAGVFIFVNTHPIRPHDFWWHLALGREIATTGQIPLIDQYSFTRSGELYPSNQMFWLFDSVMYYIYQFGGPALIILFQSLLITSAYGMLLLLCRKITKNWRIAAFSTIFAIALGINNWNVRPQSISFLLGILFLYGIYSYRIRSEWGWLVIFPIGMLLWVNSHGSFVIGLVLTGIWLGAEMWEILVTRYSQGKFQIQKSFWGAAVSFGMAAAACLVNPRGFGIINYIGTLTGSQIIQNLVPEWEPPTFDTFFGTLFLASLLISAMIMAVSPKRPSAFQVLNFLTFGTLGLMTTRGMIWFGIAMAPILADHILALSESYQKPGSASQPRPGRPLINLVMLSVLVIFSAISLPWFKHRLPLPPTKAGIISYETPLEATDFLISEQIEGNLFNDIGFGSYLIWAATSNYKVFVDTRIELYPIDQWWDYVVISNALPGWEDLLEKYDIKTVMLNLEDQAALNDSLGESSSWTLIYKDSVAAIFHRSGN